MNYSNKKVKELNNKIKKLLKVPNGHTRQLYILKERFIIDIQDSTFANVFHICKPRVYYRIMMKANSAQQWSNLNKEYRYKYGNTHYVFNLESNETDRCVNCEIEFPKNILSYVKLLQLKEKIK